MVELYGYQFDVNSEIMVIVGVMEVLYVVIIVLVCCGDEVICFDFSYDSYVFVVVLVGGELCCIVLQLLYFCVDWW